ncbi:MAG TPA: hypothetical protein VFT50_16675 [Baekduia sp.]|nr:hypothetical protein [Baekduia sp.]
MARISTPVAVAAAFAGGLAAGRALESPQARFARMAGSTIAGPDAAGWITDFLNAAYFRRPAEERAVEDLRRAFAVLTTSWHRNGGRRLRAADVLPYHRAFGRDRFLSAPRGTLDGGQLLEGAARLHGSWWPEAYADDARRAWGIAFPTAAERDAYRPESRLAGARLGPLTPEIAPRDRQVWHTYPPVAMPSAAGPLGLLTRPETWPDFASEIGRFTPLRAGGLAGQTFEIEVAAGTAAGRPLYTRGYVTITHLATADAPDQLRAYVEDLDAGLRDAGEPDAVPDGASALAAFDLTTHEGHFMGAGHNRLVLYEQDGQAWVRAAGTWDPLPWHLDQAYRRAGRDAQHAFWGQGEVVPQSMLHQLALAVAG